MKSLNIGLFQNHHSWLAVWEVKENVHAKSLYHTGKFRVRTEFKMNNKLLVDHAKTVQSLGFHPVPIIAGEGKKPPSWFYWTDLRDGKRPELTPQEIESIFSNPEVEKVGIIIDKRSFVIDYDGALGEHILWSEMIPRCSKELQRHLRSTTHTRTPHGGHIHILLNRDALPEGIEEMLCWQLLGNGHGNGNAEIRILSQNKYCIEYGQGYEPIIDIQQIITLSKEESIELIEKCKHFKLESIAIRNIASSLLPYWIKGRRQDLTFATSGYLYKNKVDVDVTRRLVQYVVQLTNDEEADTRLDAVNRTYDKDVNEVVGYSRLMELIDENESIIQRIKQQFSKIGYQFHNDNATDNTSNGDQEVKKHKIAEKLFKVVEQNIEQLFKDQLNNSFAAVKIDGHIETIPIINNGKFKMWVCKTYYETQKELMTNTDALAAVCNMLQAKAYFGKKTISLDIRTSGNGLLKDTLRIHYDLTNNDWEQVEITPDGWSIKKSTEAPTIFRRQNNHLPQVYPSRAYPDDIFDQFMILTNATVRDKDGNILPDQTKQLRLLLKCYIVSLFIPEIPKAALMLHGDEGGAKSALQELIKSLVDPSMMLTLTFPQDVKELIQQLSHNHIAYYDNVNHKLPDWVSDLLCRVITGSGFSKRMLYTDDDDIIYNIIRCIGINGINLAATKADLLDRSLIIRLSRLPKRYTRKLKDDIWPAFQRMKPQLLGYIFDILVKVLQIKRDGKIDLNARSRMADWEEYTEIIARCMGYKPMEFIKAYEENKNVKTETVLADSPTAQAVLKLVESGDFRGTATQLLHELEPIAQELGTNTKGRAWPKSASALSRKLNELKTNLLESGVQVYSVVENTKTKVFSIVIHKMPPDTPEAPEESKSRSNTQNHAEMSDGVSDFDDQTTPEILPDNTCENHAQNEDSGGSGGLNDIYSNTSEKSAADPKLNYDNAENSLDLYKFNVSQAAQMSQLQKSNFNIYRLGNTDSFACPYCSIKDDMYTIEDHNCSGSLRKSGITKLGVVKPNV